MDLVRISDAAIQLGISTSQLRKLINSGRLSVIQLGTSARGDRLEQSEIDDFIKRSRITRRNPSCPYISEAVFGGTSSKSTAEKLDKVLGKPRKGKRSKLSA